MDDEAGGKRTQSCLWRAGGVWVSRGRGLETSGLGRGLQMPVVALCGRRMGEGWRAAKGLWEWWAEKQSGPLGAESKMKEGEPISLARQR